MRYEEHRIAVRKLLEERLGLRWEYDPDLIELLVDIMVAYVIENEVKALNEMTQYLFKDLIEDKESR